MSFYDLFQAWARVGRAHNTTELRELTKASQVATDVMRESAVLLIDEAAGRPLLVSYMADGTPIVTRHHVRQAMDGEEDGAAERQGHGGVLLPVRVLRVRGRHGDEASPSCGARPNADDSG